MNVLDQSIATGIVLMELKASACDNIDSSYAIL